MAGPPWGGYPRHHPPPRPGAGIGIGHNARMLGRVDKAILRGPLYRAVKPAWFYDKAGARRIGERLAAFHAAPGVRRLAGLIGRSTLHLPSVSSAASGGVGATRTAVSPRAGCG